MEGQTLKFQIFRSLRKSCWNNLLLDQISSQRRIVVYSFYSPVYFVFFVIFTTFIRQTNAENIFSFLEWSFFLFSNCFSSFSRIVFLPFLEWSFFLFSNSLSSFSRKVFFQMAGHERRGRRKNERTDAPENHLSNRNVRTNSSRSDYRLFGRKINLVNDFLSRFPWKWKAFTLVPFLFFFFLHPRVVEQSNESNNKV